MMRRLLVSLLLFLASCGGMVTPVHAETCDEILKALGLAPDSVRVVCPVPSRIVLLELIPSADDTLVITPQGDTLSWPIGAIPDLTVPSYVFGLQPGSYLLGSGEVPWGLEATAGVLTFDAPPGDVWLSRVQDP